MTLVDDLKARLNIVDVVGAHVRLVKAGAHWKGLCPFHTEKTPSFIVNEERQSYHCFGCGKGGDVLNSVMETENVSFRETLTLLADRCGIDVAQYFDPASGAQHTDERKRLYEILEKTCRFFVHQLQRSRSGEKVRSYLHDRGIRDQSIATFRLGFAPRTWDALVSFLLSCGFTHDEIVAAGVGVRRMQGGGAIDRFRERIMFPITDPLGRIVGFTGRILPGDDETKGKYVNTPETALYHKGRVLYGIAHAKDAMKKKNRAILVEGNLDVIAAHQSGLSETVAASGTALTAEQCTLIRRYTDAVVLFFDADHAGQAALERSLIVVFQAGLSASVIVPEHGKDAADLAADDPTTLTTLAAHATDALAFFVERALDEGNPETPDGKQRIVERLAPLLAALTKSIVKDERVRRIAERLAVSPQAVNHVIAQTESLLYERGADHMQEPTKDSFTPVHPLLAHPNIHVQSKMRVLARRCLTHEGVWRHIAETMPPLLRTLPLIEKLIVVSGEACAYDTARLLAAGPEEMRQIAEELLRSDEDALENGDEEDIMRYCAGALAQYNVEECVRALNDARAKKDIVLVAVLSEQLSAAMAVHALWMEEK